MARMKRKMLDFEAKHAIGREFDKHCSKHIDANGDKVAHYEPGWSDRRMYDTLRREIPDLTLNHIVHYREGVFGSMGGRRLSGNTKGPGIQKLTEAMLIIAEELGITRVTDLLTSREDQNA